MSLLFLNKDNPTMITWMIFSHQERKKKKKTVGNGDSFVWNSGFFPVAFKVLM